MKLSTQPILSLFHVIANTCLIDLYPASVVSWCLMICKPEKLSNQRFQVKPPPSSPSGNSEVTPPPMHLKFQTLLLPPPPPHAFRILVQEIPSPSEFQDAAHAWYGMDVFWNNPIIHVHVNKNCWEGTVPRLAVEDAYTSHEHNSQSLYR